jgi:hypothetical protein
MVIVMTAPTYNHISDDEPRGGPQLGSERDWVMRRQREIGQGRRVSYEDWLGSADRPPNRGGGNKASRNVSNAGKGLAVSRPKNQRNVSRKTKATKRTQRTAAVNEQHENSETQEHASEGKS